MLQCRAFKKIIFQSQNLTTDAKDHAVLSGLQCSQSFSHSRCISNNIRFIKQAKELMEEKFSSVKLRQ